MVVNLEAVRMIITANQVFLLSGGRAFGGGGGDHAACGKPGAGLLFALMAGGGSLVRPRMAIDGALPFSRIPPPAPHL
jgi:hypothetical protein